MSEALKRDVEGVHCGVRAPATFMRDLRTRERLSAAVDRLAHAIASGEATPDPIELEQLAQLCEEYFLRPDAARIRRWIAAVTDRSSNVSGE